MSDLEIRLDERRLAAHRVSTTDQWEEYEGVLRKRVRAGDRRAYRELLVNLVDPVAYWQSTVLNSAIDAACHQGLGIEEGLAFVARVSAEHAERILKAYSSLARNARYTKVKA